MNYNQHPRLWALVDEPLVNEHFKTIEELEVVLAIRIGDFCRKK